jgi:hypothetical protein
LSLSSSSSAWALRRRGQSSAASRKAQPLAEDAAAEELLRAPHAGAARRANEKLAEALGPDAAQCLAEFRPRDCARPVAETLRERYRRCEVEEVCAAAEVHREVSPRRLLAAPDSAHLAGHPVCWLRAFAVRLVEERRSFKSGIETYEAMLKAADAPDRRETEAERYSALIKALTGREPRIRRRSDGTIEIICGRKHLDGFMRYTELADAIKRWLEKTSRQ